MPDVRGQSVTQRLALCRDLLDLRHKLAAAPDETKIKARVLALRRAASIRKVLLGRDDTTLADELLSPAVMAEKIKGALLAVKDAPAHERDAAAVYAHAIASTMSVIASAEGRIGVGPGSDGLRALRDAIAEAGFDAYRSDFADGYIDASIARGKIVDDQVRDALDSAAKGGTEADYAVEEATRQLAGRYDEIYAEYQRLRDAAIQAAKEHGGESPQYLEARAAWDAFDTKQLVPAQVAKTALDFEPKRRAKAAFANVGQRVIERMLEASPVSVEAAEGWAQGQEITPQAAARLKKIGYPLDELRRDMAEFYRFTGGRLAAVRVHSKGDRRANATDIESHGKVGTINLDSSFDKRVLWHELAHHMEADPVAKVAAGRFIRRRALDGGKVYSLRSLTGSKGYRADEGAYKDHFFDHYVGKVYRNGVTEVFSMAVESFSNPELLARRLAVDPETLEFVAGFVKAPRTPLADAHMGLREIVRQMEDDVLEANEEAAGALIKKVAASVQFTPDTDLSWAEAMGWYVVRYGEQLGRLESTETGTVVYVASGKVKNPDTRRLGAGLILFWPWTGGASGLRAFSLPTKDLDYARASVALYARTGAVPSWYSLNNPEFLQKNL